jgi:hypothetical protein
MNHIVKFLLPDGTTAYRTVWGEDPAHVEKRCRKIYPTWIPVLIEQKQGEVI